MWIMQQTNGVFCSTWLANIFVFSMQKSVNLVVNLCSNILSNFEFWNSNAESRTLILENAFLVLLTYKKNCFCLQACQLGIATLPVLAFSTMKPQWPVSSDSASDSCSSTGASGHPRWRTYHPLPFEEIKHRDYGLVEHVRVSTLLDRTRILRQWICCFQKQYSPFCNEVVFLFNEYAFSHRLLYTYTFKMRCAIYFHCRILNNNLLNFNSCPIFLVLRSGKCGSKKNRNMPLPLCVDLGQRFRRSRHLQNRLWYNWERNGSNLP